MDRGRIELPKDKRSEEDKNLKFQKNSILILHPIMYFGYNSLIIVKLLCYLCRIKNILTDSKFSYHL